MNFGACVTCFGFQILGLKFLLLLHMFFSVRKQQTSIKCIQILSRKMSYIVCIHENVYGGLHRVKINFLHIARCILFTCTLGCVILCWVYANVSQVAGIVWFAEFAFIERVCCRCRRRRATSAMNRNWRITKRRGVRADVALSSVSARGKSPSAPAYFIFSLQQHVFPPFCFFCAICRKI